MAALTWNTAAKDIGQAVNTAQINNIQETNENKQKQTERMKHKKPALIAMLLLIVISVLFYFWVGSLQRKAINNNQHTGLTNNTIPTWQRSLFKVKNKLDQQFGITPSEAQQRLSLSKQLQKYISFGAGFNMDSITFYGKVIDQYGAPVVDAGLDIGLGGSALRGGGRIRRATDVNGYFSVKDMQGSDLHIGITRPSKKYDSFLTTDPDFPEFYGKYNTVLFRGHPHTKSDKTYLWTNYTTPEAAYVFNMWKFDEQKYNVVIGGGGTYITSGENINDPDTNHIKFKSVYQNKTKVYRSLTEEFDMRVFAKLKSDRNKHYRQTWEIEIEIPGGGFIESTNDHYMNHAPESGYDQSILRFGHKVDDPDFKYNYQHKRYFFQLADGRKGAIHFEDISSGRNSNLLRTLFSYKINLDGGTNLEYRGKGHWTSR